MKHNSLKNKEMKKIIKSVKSENAFGYDEISTKLLKVCSPLINSPLNHICNKLLSPIIFPDHLKCSVIKPLFKKVNRNNISNCRPISLLTPF